MNTQDAVQLAYDLYGNEDWLESVVDGVTWDKDGKEQPVLIFRIVDLEEAKKECLPHFINNIPIVTVWKL